MLEILKKLDRNLFQSADFSSWNPVEDINPYSQVSWKNILQSEGCKWNLQIQVKKGNHVHNM